MPGTKEEEIEKRRNRVRQAAMDSIASRGQFNFRLDGNDIKRLYVLAKKTKRPVSSMVREWVLDRLEKEEGKKKQSSICQLIITETSKILYNSLACWNAGSSSASASI